MQGLRVFWGIMKQYAGKNFLRSCFHRLTAKVGLENGSHDVITRADPSHSTHSAIPSTTHLGHKLRATANSGQALLRTSFTDLPSEMPAADSHMTTSFFILQTWMLDSRRRRTEEGRQKMDQRRQDA